jgi:hypothetical protein
MSSQNQPNKSDEYRLDINLKNYYDIATISNVKFFDIETTIGIVWIQSGDEPGIYVKFADLRVRNDKGSVIFGDREKIIDLPASARISRLEIVADSEEMILGTVQTETEDNQSITKLRLSNYDILKKHSHHCMFFHLVGEVVDLRLFFEKSADIKYKNASIFQKLNSDIIICPLRWH